MKKNFYHLVDSKKKSRDGIDLFHKCNWKIVRRFQ